MTVAGPPAVLSPISRTGFRFVSVKYPVSSWMVLASTRPMSTAPIASQRGLPRVVLWDTLLDLAHQVGADVGRLGEDAPADPHEHRQQRGAEGEALQHVRGVRLEDQHHDRRAEQAEADGEHAGHAAGAEGD